MKLKKKNLNKIEEFLEKFSEKYSCYYESFYEIRKGRKLSLKIGKKIGSDLTKLEKINEQIWDFSSVYSWNFTSFLCSSLWNTDEVLHKNVSTFVNKILLKHNQVSEKKTEQKKEINLKKLKKNVDISPYTVFWEAKSILPKNNDKEGCLDVILKALSNIDEDIGEHGISNYNSYFEPVNEDAPSYDEHLEYQEYYIKLLKKVKRIETVTQKEFEYTYTIEINEPTGVINIDTHKSDHDDSYYISFLSSIYWDTPEKYRKNIYTSFHKSLDQFNNRPEKPISIELLKARNNTYDSPEIAQLLIDYATPLWGKINELYKFNYVIKIINEMPLYGQEVKKELANELAKKEKISEIKKYLDFFKESSFHFILNHEKLKKSLIKKVSQTKGNRIIAIQHLAYFSDEEVQQVFINCLSDSNSSIVYQAIKALSHQKNLTLSIQHIKELFLNNDKLEYYLKDTIFVFSKIKDPVLSEFLISLKETYIKNIISDESWFYYKTNLKDDVNFNEYDTCHFDKFYSSTLNWFDLIPEDITNLDSYENNINGIIKLVLDYWKCE